MGGSGYQEIFDRNEKFREGRICKYPDCKTILSVYNKEKYCALHIRKINSDKIDRLSKNGNRNK